MFCGYCWVTFLWASLHILSRAWASSKAAAAPTMPGIKKHRMGLGRCVSTILPVEMISVQGRFQLNQCCCGTSHLEYSFKHFADGRSMLLMCECEFFPVCFLSYGHPFICTNDISARTFWSINRNYMLPPELIQAFSCSCIVCNGIAIKLLLASD